MKFDIGEINKALDKEIEFAKGCGMPQFVMGLIQAKIVLNDIDIEKEKKANQQY